MLSGLFCSEMKFCKLNLLGLFLIQRLDVESDVCVLSVLDDIAMLNFWIKKGEHWHERCFDVLGVFGRRLDQTDLERRQIIEDVHSVLPCKLLVVIF